MRQVIPAESNVGVAVFVQMVKALLSPHSRVGVCPGSTHHISKMRHAHMCKPFILAAIDRAMNCVPYIIFQAHEHLPKRSCSQ
jgi:hypothetical protein